MTMVLVCLPTNRMKTSITKNLFLYLVYTFMKITSQHNDGYWVLVIE